MSSPPSPHWRVPSEGAEGLSRYSQPLYEWVLPDSSRWPSQLLWAMTFLGAAGLFETSRTQQPCQEGIIILPLHIKVNWVSETGNWGITEAESGWSLAHISISECWGRSACSRNLNSELELNPCTAPSLRSTDISWLAWMRCALFPLPTELVPHEFPAIHV